MRVSSPVFCLNRSKRGPRQRAPATSRRTPTFPARYSLLFDLLFSVSTAAISIAETWDVPEEVPTIAEALENAQPGDSVAVHPGYYFQDDPLVLDTDLLTIYGTEQHEAWIFSEWLPYALLTIRADGCVLSDLSFMYQNMSTIIWIDLGSDSTVIRGNYLDGAGGSDAILDAGLGTRVIDNEFEATIVPYSNTYAGGGVFESNRINHAGGGLRIFRSCLIRGNMIVGTRAGFDYGGTLRGGGIFAYGVDGSLTIEDNDISECRTIGSTDQWYSRGGGIYISGCSDVNIEGNRIVRNQAVTGGGIYAEMSSIHIAGNLVWANGDTVGGNEDFPGIAGGIYLEDCQGEVWNNTIMGNTATIDAGGMYLQFASGLLIERNIVVENWSEGIGGVALSGVGPSVFGCNDVWLNAEWNYGGDWAEDPTGLNGNISLDPEFCSPDSGNFQLRETSPCAGQGEQECGVIGAYGVGCGAQAVPEGTDFRPRWLSLFPNPTRGTLTIQLAADDAAQNGELLLLDTQGRRVRDLCRNGCAATLLHWDGRLEDGRRAPSGVYYVVLRRDHELSRQKLILLR